MADIYVVVNGVTKWDEQDVNQFAQALNNQFGILSTTQERLGRLVLPRDDAFPDSPVDGQVVRRTDQGPGDGRLYIYHESIGRWIPYFGSQVQSSDGMTTVFDSGTFADGPETAAIQTWGGHLRISLKASADPSLIEISAGGGEGPQGILRPVVGAVALAEMRFGSGNPADVSFHYPPSMFQWWYTPPSPDSYTIKLQGKVGGTSQGLALTNVALVVEEFAHP